MLLCEWDSPEGNPGMLRSPVCFRILSSSLTSVPIFSVWCHSSKSISVVFIMKLRRETRRRFGDGGIRDGEI
jgi:hypothetical protein